MVSLKDLEAKLKTYSKILKDRSKGKTGGSQDSKRYTNDLFQELKKDGIEAVKDKSVSHRGETFKPDIWVEDVAAILVKDRSGQQDSDQVKKLKEATKLPVIIVNFGTDGDPQVKTA